MFLDLTQRASIHRYVGPTMREQKKRKEKLGPDPDIRTNFLEWNYNSEIFAFGKRLNENFDTDLLKKAFKTRSFVILEEQKQKEVGLEGIPLEDNLSLVKRGEHLIETYINEYVKKSLPLLPDDGIDSVRLYLMSTDILSHISSNLGTKDLILSSVYPPDQYSFTDALKAIIGALAESSGDERAGVFIKDFICTQLNQKDINDIWEIERPLERLEELCDSQKLGKPEPRLISEAGKNTILAAYHVGIYLNKIQIGNGFGEDVSTAVQMASRDSLNEIFKTQNSMKPFDFKNLEKNASL